MALNSNIIQINGTTAIAICQSIASRVKNRRLEMNLTQTGLASRAGVNIETYRKFERTGEISLRSLVKIAYALNMTDDFNSLFAEKQYQSMDELLTAENTTRKRGQKS
jgi:transcriptional regulator with XRE-family HTH domain